MKILRISSNTTDAYRPIVSTPKRRIPASECTELVCFHVGQCYIFLANQHYPVTSSAASGMLKRVVRISRNVNKNRAPTKNMSLLLSFCSLFLGACGTPAPNISAASASSSQPVPASASRLTMQSYSTLFVQAVPPASVFSAIQKAAKTQSQAGTAAAPSISNAITNVRIENAGSAAQANVPLTFGQVFAQGGLGSTETVAGQLEDGTVVPLQVDVKARHADGSLRHVVISAILPKLASGQTQTLHLVRKNQDVVDKHTQNPVKLPATFSARVNVNLGGQIYSASPEAFIKGGQFTSWLAGPIANEWQVSAPLRTAAGVAHPHLTARFAIRAYSGSATPRVDVTVENAWAYEPGPQNFTYDAEVLVNGKAVYSQPALTHYHHARWRKIFWAGAPAVNIKHNIAYLLATKAVPNYDTGITISPTALSAIKTRWSSGKTEPMQPGIVNPAMPMAGGRPDIGPLPQWAAMYLLSMDGYVKNIMLGTGDLAGSWPIHYRDKNTGHPVSLNDYPYMTLLGNPGDTVNPATKKSESFPACGGTCSTAPYNYNPDGNHQPSLAYLPYLVTGDYYYLEELLFWANWNMVQANPYYRDFTKGLLKWNEVRGQAWSLRTLGQAAYITPDRHPMKQYFVERINQNLNWYNTTYTTGNPNQLGAYDGTGKWAYQGAIYSTSAGPRTGLAPWQDDFFTWSIGHLVELGFTNAQPLLAWKAKFPVGRMTAPGFCWIDGASYTLTVRASETSPLSSSFAEAYQATMVNKDGTAMINSTGAAYLAQACGSQAQADWRTQYDKDNRVTRKPWQAGEMTGAADSVAGYPSNMQPALAVAATSGIPNAQAAWAVFINRSVKPNYAEQPQWAIVPRNP